MLSIKHKLSFIIQRAILTAYPIKEEPLVHHVPIGNDLFQYDYFCQTPKLLFDKYKRSNSFYGRLNEQAVAEDIRVQIPENEMISQINVTKNGYLQIKLDDQFVRKNIENYKKFITPFQRKSGLICLPSITNGQQVGYEIFRAFNIAEKLQRIMTKLNYNTRVVFPLIDQIEIPDHPLARLFIVKNYQKLLNNQFFQLDHDLLLSSDTMDEFSDIFKSLAKVNI